ncbi:Immunoglobulin-like and fibronectin type III domain containing protein 1 [Dissostichus eleginoides]|nr:Immunoglobulin-like and fibronectin type III domain containing protein 1 [Dissostichus eleginoides]
MFKISKVADVSATGQDPDAEFNREVGIKKKSRVPGVMITQYIEELPEGKTHPDFTRKPIALTIQEGKFAYFKAIVTGDPEPTMPNVMPDQADTYKCFAKNEFGQAVVTVVLNVIAVGFNKNAAQKPAAEAINGNFKTVLKRKSKVRPKSEQPERKDGEIDPKFWELLLSAKKKDYEAICAEFGITDFRWMLKKLNEIKKEREEEQAEFIKSLSNLKPMQFSSESSASFEIDMDLIDPSSSVFIYKDGVMVPYTKDMGEKMKHTLKQVGRKFIFSMKDLLPDDAGLYQLDVEGVNMFSTDFKIPMVDFLVKIQEVKAESSLAMPGLLLKPIKMLKREKNQRIRDGPEEVSRRAADEINPEPEIVKEPDPPVVEEVKPEPVITSALSDVYVLRGNPADLTVKIDIDCDSSWFKDGEQLNSGSEVKITKDGTSHNLSIRSCSEDDSGLYRFETGSVSTQGKVTVGVVPEFDPDDLHKFSKPVIVRVGQNAAFKMPLTPQEGLVVSWFKDGAELNDGGGVKIVREPNHSRLLLRDCLRTDAGEIKIQLKNPFGAVEATSRLIVLDRPGPPEGPVEVVESTSTMIEIQWNPPKDDGCSPVTNYLIERQQEGQSNWMKLGDVLADKTSFRDRNVAHGKIYNYRIYAENPQGVSDSLETADSIMAGILILSGPPGAPTVVSTTKTCITLTWTPPEDDRGVPIIGYQLEKRKKDTNQWIALNAVNEPIEDVNYAVKDVTEGAEYEFRVAAINESGAGDPSPPSEMVCAKNPNMRPCFKDPEDFIVVRAGNSVRVNICYEAEPPPQITWLRNDEPISPWISVINTEGMSQLVIPSSKRSDSAIYTIHAKNSVGEASFDIEVRVTDEPKSPGPVELEQTVQDKVMISWAPSPDQELDDRLYYMVSQHDSNTRVWRNIADRLFTNTYTASKIYPGREYHFRVYAKNDMGLRSIRVSHMGCQQQQSSNIFIWSCFVRDQL